MIARPPCIPPGRGLGSATGRGPGGRRDSELPVIMRLAFHWTAAVRRSAVSLVLVLTVTMVAVVLSSSAVAKGPPVPPKQAVAVGTGGAAATVDPLASQAAIRVLDQGGNAVDAAVAAAAVLGVTEPYTCGIGGGGFMVLYLAADERVVTIDARETAPQAFQPDSFIDPATGQPIPFDERVTSGLGVGVPGTIEGWEQALDEFGSKPLSELLQLSIRLAASGFTVDQTYRQQTLDNL